jgi:hypothetical protein
VLVANEFSGSPRQFDSFAREDGRRFDESYTSSLAALVQKGVRIQRRS